MTDALLTLTTDFGPGSAYAAVLKGVILGINPQARVLDLTHQIPPQDLRYTAFFLETSLPYFPPGVVHVVVVDPGVGTDRALLYVEAGGLRLLVPDNGCWTPVVEVGGTPPCVRRLQEARYWRHPVSATFHGRDILAPVAGWLSRGLDAEALGPPVASWTRLDRPTVDVGPHRLTGEVVFVDHFGNVITNIRGDAFLAFAGRPVRVTIGGAEVSKWVRTYAEAEPGSLVALVGSAGTLEVAVVQGSAAERVRAAVGARVEVVA
jgi:S-adenosylmethionine hydrolase